jgi:hypothetical protein
MQPQYKNMDEFLNEDNPGTTEESTVEKTPEELAAEAAAAAEAKTPEELAAAKTPEELAAEAKAVKKPEANPMKELRDKANAAAKSQEKIDNAINRLSDGEYNFKLKDFKNEHGKVDYDALISAMDESDVKKRAETRGLSPEMQAEIERYEKEKRVVEMDKARVQMDRQLNNFQMEQQLSSDDLNNFIADSMKLGINPLSIAALDRTTKGTTSLKMLYKAVYTDKIVKEATTKAVEEARVKWEADLVAKGAQPKQNPANPNNTKTTKTDPKGMALDDFLNTLNN